MSKQKIALIGGAGFIGSHLVRRLLKRDDFSLIVVDIDHHRIREDKVLVEHSRLECIHASITDKDVVERVVKEAEIIFSMSALCRPSLYNTQPRQVIAASYNDILPLIDAATKAKRRLIHLSTCETHGKYDGLLNEDQSPFLLGPIYEERWSYACAKQLLERTIWAAHKHEGLATTIVRPFNVIGPQMDFIPGVDGEGIPRVIASFAHALLAQKPLMLVDGGKARRAFLYIDDFISGLEKIIDTDASIGEVINLGAPEHNISIEELANLMIDSYLKLKENDRNLAERANDYQPKTEVVTAKSFYGEGYADVMVRYPDIEKAKRLLDWSPTVDLKETIELTLRDYVTRYAKIID